MHEIAKFLGFASLQGAIWNIVGYVCLTYLILAVLYPRYERLGFITAALWLGAYAFIFLNNVLLGSLEIFFSAVAMVQYDLRASKRVLTTITILWGAAVFYLLFFSGLPGSLTGTLLALESVKILGAIAFLFLLTGLVILPKHFAFPVMAGGGVLLVFYAFLNGAWVFFLLNIIFVIANLYKWLKPPILKPIS